MKRFFVLPILVALAFFVSCQKQQTEEERRAEIDREVQQKLDAERQAQEKDQLAQQRAELDARAKALADKEAAANRARESESRRRTERVERAPVEPRGAKSYDMFYTRLERYGDWRESADYGYVWQPREAQRRDWRPYTNGHWVYSDAGWTWISEEPFGWATYHYGRWVRLRNTGWVWVPGDEWAPAWVSWRTSNNYVGWAPLPPEARFDRRTGIHNWSDNYYDIGPEQYCFVEQREFGSPRVERAVVPVERNVTIVNETTNVTNITYNNTTIVNQGPNYDEVRAHSSQPIQRYRLERQTEFNADNPQAVVRGEVIEVPAPVIVQATVSSRPPSLKEAIATAVVEHGWEMIANKQEADKARKKMKSEATPPQNAPPKTFVKPATAGNAPASTTAASESRAESTPSTTETASPAPAVSQTPAMRMRSSVAPVATVTPTATATATPTATASASATATASPSPRSTYTSPSAAATTATTSTSASPSATASAPTFTPAGRMTTHEKKAERKKEREEFRNAERSSSELASPTATMTPQSTPIPVATPRHSPPSFSPSTTPSPSAAESSPKTERQSALEQTPTATPTPRSTVTPTASASASVAEAASDERGEKKNKKHKHERDAFEEPEVSPSATPTP